MTPAIANKKTECCGCNACAEICPKHCITMVDDAKGFLYPKVDTAACIECGVCERVCPLRKENIRLNVPLKAFAAWNKDESEYLASSSGGAAQVFSSYIIKQGGVVYGCTSESMHIRHIRVDSLSELSKLQGSKYVQSDVQGLFSQVKADMQAGKPVLFIGTPCQVAGLKNYIRRIPENLYLVDLICHGVPSQQMLHEHIGKIAKGRNMEQLSFRKGQLFRLELQGGSSQNNGETEKWKYTSEPHKDMYYRAFLHGISYRESCYECPFARKERASDITIGDFWGLQNSEELTSTPNEGISVVLPSTDKGEKLVAAVSKQMNLYERNVDEAVKGNTQLRNPTERTLSQWIFNKLYPMLLFGTVVKAAIIPCRATTLLRICINRITNGIGKQ